jgi:hypothetical protein
MNRLILYLTLPLSLHLCASVAPWLYSKGEADSVSDRREVHARLLELRLPITRAGAKRGRGHG